DGGDVVEHLVARTILLLQIGQHGNDALARQPQGGHTFRGVLAYEGRLAELFIERVDDLGTFSGRAYGCVLAQGCTNRLTGLTDHAGRAQRSDLVRTSQLGGHDAVPQPGVALHDVGLTLIDSLVVDDPGQRPSFFTDRFL